MCKLIFGAHDKGTNIENGLIIHVLSGCVWPSHLLSATTYSSLQLPLELEEIKKEFNNFYAIEAGCSINNVEDYGEDRDFIRPHCVLLQGAIGQYDDLNGEYTEMCELNKTKYPMYIKKTNHKYIIQYSTINQRWKIKSKSCQETSSYIAHSENMTDKQNLRNNDQNIDASYARMSLPTDVKYWKLFDGGEHTSALNSTITVTPVLPAGPEMIDGVLTVAALMDMKFNEGPKKPLTLIWCHQASTAMLTVNLYNGSKGYIFASIPQATIILAFTDPKITYLSIHQICVLTKLNFKEVKNLLSSLINKSNPILEYSTKDIQKNEVEYDSRNFSTPPKNSTKFPFDMMGSRNSRNPSPTGINENSPNNSQMNKQSKNFHLDDNFSVNVELLKGNLGGLKISSPIVVTSDILHSNSDLMHDCGVGGEGLRSMHSWRNELIDACVVRRLKIASRGIKYHSLTTVTSSFSGPGPPSFSSQGIHICMYVYTYIHSYIHTR
jgi:hypothetical protein